MPNEPGNLLNVISIMQKSVVYEFQYCLTHAMQHENASIVFLEIQQLQSDENIGHIRPQILLEVTGNLDYNVRRNDSHSGDGQAQVCFLVTPRLPDHINKVQFVLIPYATPIENPPKVIILDQKVKFGRDLS
ncbi:hypothetical protein D3C73_597790 [compost metagenome]